MTDNLNAEIIAVGTEILLGEITDTNSVYMAQHLRDYGVNLYFMTSVGDNAARIASAVQIALGRADVVLTCGGLGPTVDDMTRQGIAEAFQRPLVFQQALYDQIAARFARFNSQMTDNNRRQAYLPEGAIAIENPVGTAPGFMVEQANKVVISLPGVPREMKYLMQQAVLPYLLGRYKLGTIRARILKAAGIGESALDELLGEALLSQSNPTVGLAAHHGIIDIRVTAKADTAANADVMLDAATQAVVARAGAYIFGTEQDRLEDVLIRLLRQHQAGIVAVEAGIAGAILSKLQSVIAAEDVLTYTRQYTHPRELAQDTQQGAEVDLQNLVKHAAEALCHAHGASGAIVIASLPDVDENADVQVATAVAVYTPQEAKSRVYGFGAKSDLARDWVSRWAMAYLWRMLGEQLQHVG